MHANYKIEDTHSLQRAITAIKLSFASSIEYYSTLALSAGFRAQGKLKMSFDAIFCEMRSAPQKITRLQATGHFNLDRHSAASRPHRHLINILFSLRVLAAPSNKFDGTYAAKHAGLKINSTIRRCAFIHD